MIVTRSILCALVLTLMACVESIPVSTPNNPILTDWQGTLSKDTLHRLDLARQHLDDNSATGQAFRNDTIMRINIEREALNLPLIDLSQAFGIALPASRGALALVVASEPGVDTSSNTEEIREQMYTRGGAMYWVSKKRSDAEDLREEMYTRGGAMYYPSRKRSDAEEIREQMYTRGGAMYWVSKNRKRGDAEELREEMYTRGGSMYSVSETEGGVDSTRRAAGEYVQGSQFERRTDDEYSSLLDRKSLALGAIERVNIARRILGKPEITMEEAKATASKNDKFVSDYWNASISHGGFWTGDQVVGKPNFIEGGQANGFGFTQSGFHKLHCLANLRMMLSWHIAGQGDRMTRDMTVHAMHCLEYLRYREQANPDLTEEPIDTVDYRGMGIH